MEFKRILSLRCFAVKTIVTIGYDSTNPGDRELWIKQKQIDGVEGSPARILSMFAFNIDCFGEFYWFTNLT